MVDLWEANEPVEKLMEIVRAEDAKASPQVGRNDPCPCGSGRKYKQCCLRKQRAARETRA